MHSQLNVQSNNTTSVKNKNWYELRKMMKGRGVKCVHDTFESQKKSYDDKCS